MWTLERLGRGSANDGWFGFDIRPLRNASGKIDHEPTNAEA